MRKNREKIKRTKLINFTQRHDEALRHRKVKSLIDFHEEYSSSIKSIAIKKNDKINLTTRFSNGKMLMFTKRLIKSFIYDMTDVFMFPNKVVSEIYQKYNVNKYYLYQNLTDTDSTSLFFSFICDSDSNIREDKVRNIIFEVITKSRIFDRLDLLDKLWEMFDARNTNLKNQVGLFDVESINKSNIITIALNPKGYYERFIDHSDNKKHKGLKKSVRGMDFDSYSERLADLNEFSKEFIEKPKKMNKKVSNYK